MVVHFLEVGEGSASGDCSKTMKTMGQCIDVDQWDSLDDEFLDLVLKPCTSANVWNLYL